MQISPIRKEQKPGGAQAIPVAMKKHLSFREAARLIYETEGAKGFTRGLTPSLIKNSLMTG
jgi:hypothetical protein